MALELGMALAEEIQTVRREGSGLASEYKNASRKHGRCSLGYRVAMRKQSWQRVWRQPEYLSRCSNTDELQECGA